MTVRVSVVDDYRVVVAGVNALLAPFADRIEVVDCAAVLAGPEPVNVVLYDTFAAPVGKYAPVPALLGEPLIESVALYSFATSTEVVADSLAVGAQGVLSKSLPAAQLVEGIEKVAAGQREMVLSTPGLPVMRSDRWPAKEAGLSAREAELVALIVQGLSNVDIAKRCYLSPNTIKTYIREAYRKMGVRTRAQAVAWGIGHGLKPDRPCSTGPSRAKISGAPGPMA